VATAQFLTTPLVLVFSRDVFNTSNTDDVVRMILETGEITKGTGMASKKQDSTRH
jgi:ribosome maturation protein Sdo1